MMLSIFINLSFLVYVTISYSYDCSDTNSPCKDTNIDCLSNEDCFISCKQDKLCQNSIIQCPINGDCNIECDGYKSCQNVVINATNAITGNLNIVCYDASQECESLRIYGSIYQHQPNTQQNDLSLLCNGDVQSCYKSKIICPVSGDCLIQCPQDESCKNITVTGPSDGDLNVECGGTDSCIQATINAEDADELDVSGCAREDSCLDLTIHCPPMANISNPNCFLQGNDNLGSYSGQGINIYAVNGWQDIEITYSGSYGSRHQGTMHCGVDYATECSFASSSWECADMDAYCNNVWTPDTTPAPTDDIIQYNATYTYPPIPNFKQDKYHGALGMVLISSGLIFLVFACVICGAIRKQLDKAERKLSEMGIKSPFKSPYSGPAPPGHFHHGGHHAHPHSNKHKKGGHGKGHGHGHGTGRKHKHGENINMEPQRIADMESSYSHGMQRVNSGHNSGYYASHGITRPNTAPANGLYTANIHRPDSTSHNKYIINQNGTRTAEINRPNSAQMPGQQVNHSNYNEYGQHVLAQLGVHGHSGHNNKGFRGNGHNQHQQHQHQQHRHQHSSHGHGHGHVPGHNKRSKPNHTEMMIMNDVRIR